MSNSKNICAIVLNNFTNDSRVLKENISLQNAGYSVGVVSLHESPLEEFEDIQKIPVHRVKLKSRGWSKHKLVQLLKYIEFAYCVIRKYKNSHILHCNDLGALPIGVIIKKYFNRHISIVYDAHEYETEIYGLNGLEKKLKQMLEKWMINYADKVITVSDSIANEYANMYNIEKPSLVLNTPPYKDIQKKDIFRETLGIKDEQAIFLYQGGLFSGRGLEVIIETFKQLVNDNNVIVFMGYGPLETFIKNVSKKYTNIYFHPAVFPDVLLEYTSSADFGISTIKDSCLSYRYCLPNKLFEYFMAGIPVIVSNLYEMKKIVQNYGVGIVSKENTVQGLEDAIKEVVKLNQDDLNNNIQKVKKIYNWEEQEKMLLKVYKELC